jgi:hypothetical protein
MRSLLLITTSIALLACGGSTAEPGKPSSNDGQEPADIDTKMHANFETIGDMRSALERGELEEARSRATELGERLRADLYPAKWATQLQPVRDAVTDTKAAQDLPTATLATSRAGHSCGDCHRALGAAVIKEQAPPPAQSSLPRTAFMQQHAWAAQRMWEGLIGPSDESWKRGADALAKVPALDTSNMSEEMQALAARLPELAKAASSAEDGPQRVEVYGSFLATCAACHRSHTEEVQAEP